MYFFIPLNYWNVNFPSLSLSSYLKTCIGCNFNLANDYEIFLIKVFLIEFGVFFYIIYNRLLLFINPLGCDIIKIIIYIYYFVKARLVYFKIILRLWDVIVPSIVLRLILETIFVF